VIIAKKKNFLLINKESSNKQIFNLLIKKIPNSIFSKLDYKFLNDNIKKKIIKLYLIKNKKKTISLISIVSFGNYNLLKKEIFFYLLRNPYKIMINLKYFLELFSRDSNQINLKYKKDYLHLLHLIILKDKSLNKVLKFKDKLMFFFFKKILEKNDAKIFYLCYERSNLKAHNFYKRNKFKIYKKNNKVIYIKKRFYK